MEITTKFSRIIKDELFDLLRMKYRYTCENISIIKRDKKIIFFAEFLDVIERYDNWISLIEAGLLGTQQEYEKSNQEKKREIEQRILSLRYESNFLPEWYGFEIPTFRKVVQYSDGLVRNDKADVRMNLIQCFNSYLKNKGLCLENGQQNLAIATVVRSFFEISTNLQLNLVKDNEYKSLSISEDEQQYFQHFYKMLEQYKQVYVLCLDIRLYEYIEQNENDYSILYTKLEDKIIKVQSIFGGVEDLKSYLIKVEPMQVAGLNLHCILMFKCEIGKLSESGIIVQIDKKLRDVGFTPDSFAIRNWNTELRQFREKKSSWFNKI